MFSGKSTVTKHPWLPNSPEDLKKTMLEEIGVHDPLELYRDVPREVLLKRSLNVGLGRSLSEIEVKRYVEKLLSKNKVFMDPPPFMGGGVCVHHVPSAIKWIISRSEFLTAYTPYQAEISQGLLQTLFEYQSLVADLLEMDVVNASMYDGSTSVAEAFLMAIRVKHKNRIVVPETMNPQHLEVARTWVQGKNISIEEVKVDRETGFIDLEDLKNKLSKQDVAGVYMEYPSFLGVIDENISSVGEIAHDYDSLFIVGFEPLSLGILEPPGKIGADIAVGEGQPLGIGLNYGGPYLGIFATRWDRRLVRQMPGRLIGITEDIEGNRAFAMILQSREQHIRRERATSNITTNEALMAIAAAVYLSLLGREGLVKLAEHIALKAAYTARKLAEITGVKAPALNSKHFKEFSASFPVPYNGLHRYLLEHGVLGGYYIGDKFSWLGESALFCITEVHSLDDIRILIDLIEEYVTRHGGDKQ